jgi:hypothetical protein
MKSNRQQPEFVFRQKSIDVPIRKKMKKILACVLAVAASAGASATTITGPNIMQVNVPLTSGQTITSRNGLYQLNMQSGDGNLVLYAVGGGMTLPTGFNSKPGGSYAIQQYDGNFVVYKANNTWHWQAGAGGNPSGAYIMVLGEDGSLIIRGPDSTNELKVIFRDEVVEYKDHWYSTIKYRPEVWYPTRKWVNGSCVDSGLLARTGKLATYIASGRGESLGKCADPIF